MASRVPVQLSSLYGTPSPLNRSVSPPIVAQRAPTSSDTGYQLGQLWVDQVGNAYYGLIEVAGGLANWGLFASATGALNTLTGDTGGAISPSAGNLNVVATDTNTVSGSGSTLTITPTKAGYPITSFFVGPAGQGGYQTIQAALDAANVAGGGTVYVQAGHYTENLTFYDGTTLVGAIGQVDAGVLTITGTHTPPLTGQFSVYGVLFIGATSIFSSAAAGACQFNFFNVICRLTGTGFTWDLPNWTGQINIFDFLQDDGGVNGCINNPTGSMGVVIINSAIGLTQTNATALINGPVEWDNMLIAIKCQYGGSGNVNINGGCQFLNTQIFADSTTSTIVNSSFQTGANPAITTTSSGAIQLSTVNISSAATPVITGTGTVELEDVSFVQNSGLANTLTVNSGGGTRSSKFIVGTQVAPPIVTSGTGDPGGAVTAPQGSLYLRIDGSSSSTRAYINTNGTTGWTSVTTAT